MTFAGWKYLAAAVALAGSVHAAPAQETRLILTSMSPAGSVNSTTFRQWADKISADSGGTIKIDVRDGLTLANYNNVYDRVVDDVVQIGWALHSIIGGKFPLTEVAGVPFMADNAQYAGIALWRLYKTGLLDDEYKAVVPIAFMNTAQSGIHFAKPPKSTDSFSGLKIGVLNPTHGAVVRRLEGTALALPSTDFYDALQRGTMDAGILSWAAFAPFKLQEVTTYHLEGPIGANTMMFFMSRKKWDSLPLAARKALEANGGENQSAFYGKYMDSLAAEQRAPLKASSRHTIVELSPEQRTYWENNVVGPLTEQWKKDRTGGEKVVEVFKKLYADVKAGR